MKFSLGEFEQQVDETILKRGLRYFKQGHVVDVAALGGGDYEAVVKGSEDYAVNLTIGNEIVEDYVCDCPYDMGPVCKHVVAVLFYLQKEQMDVAAIPLTKSKTPKAKKSPKKKTIAEQVADILNVLSEDELKEFIRATCKSDREFRYRFLAKYTHISTPPSRELYASQIKNLVEAYSDRYGMIDYYKSREFGMAVSDMLDNAEKDIENGEIKKAVPVVFAVMEELPAVLDSSDDSSGYIGECVEFTFELLGRLAEATIDEEFRKELFNEILLTHQNRKFSGWGWDSYLISYAIQLVKSQEEKERVAAIINQIKPAGTSRDWEYSKAQELMLELIESTESSAAAKMYLMENVSNPDFRKRLIHQALENKAYDEALKLATDGIGKDKWPDDSDRWREYQLDIYQKTNDKENVIRLARYFILKDDGGFKKLYYNLLKKNIPEESWAEYLEGIIAAVFKKGNWYDYAKIASLYIWEGYWDRYLVLLQKNPNLQRIEDAEKYLAKLYPKQILELYHKSILSFVEVNVGRSHYKEACRYMRRMKKMGGSQLVGQLIETLRVSYKSRRALLEELNNV